MGYFHCSAAPTFSTFQMGMILNLALYTVWLYGISQGSWDPAFCLSFSSDPPLDTDSGYCPVFQLLVLPCSPHLSLGFPDVLGKTQIPSGPSPAQIPPQVFLGCWIKFSLLRLAFKALLGLSPADLSASPRLSLRFCSICSQMNQLPGL